MRYVENHDEERYLAEYGEPAQRAAAAVTFTLPGAPMIYAGQERGNETYRGPIRWHDGDNDQTDFHRDLAALRDAEPLLRDGAVAFDGAASAVAVVDGDADRVTAYERVDDGDGLLVVVNFDAAPATVTVPDGFETVLYPETAPDGLAAENGDAPSVPTEGDETTPTADGETVAVDNVVVLR